MENLWKSLILGALLMGVAACSGGGGDAPSTPALSSNGVAFKTLNSTIDSGGGLVANSAGATLLNKQIEKITTFAQTSGQIWSANSLLADPRCSGDENNNGMADDPYCSSTPTQGVPATRNYTVREYVGFLSDPNAVRGNGSSISVFGRVKTALGTPCAVAIILGSEGGGIPTSSEQKVITFTAAHVSDLRTVCGMDISNKIGTTITVQFDPTTDKTYYDTKITLTMGSNNMVSYIRITDAIIRVASIENNVEQANGGTRTGAYRTLVYLDRVTGALSAEYLSFSSNTVLTEKAGEFHRLYINKSNNEGVMISATLARQSAPASKYEHSKMYVLMGTPGAPTSNTAFTFIRAGDSQFGSLDSEYSSGANLFAFTGCAKQSDGLFVSADIETCAGAGTSTIGNTMKTKLQTLIDGIEVSKVTAASVAGETAGVNFPNSAAVLSTNIALGN